MEDITIIMLTPNLVPKGWAEYHRTVLTLAADGAPIITISNEPLDWGENYIQTEYSFTNIYKQMLRGAKLAKTPYVGFAEDDTLYSPAHFQFRPGLDKFGYNYNRWNIFAWERVKPFYFYKPRTANCTLIAPRELLIADFEARFAKYPDGLEGHRCPDPGVDDHHFVTFYTHVPVVGFNHVSGIDPLEPRMRKKAWPVQCYDLPGWGRAEDLIRKFA